jgi:hypothetical protein
MNNNKKNRIKSINPATEEVIQEYNIINEKEIKEKIY